MIVKNESNIITRLFNSVIEIIDTYCICDTGSTDNTVQIIKEYFDSKGITGKIITEPFKNFEYNRTIALHACENMSDYIILLDADMVLNVINFKKNNLVCDYYNILQGNASFYYNNTRIIKNNNIKQVKYVSVTHEYISFPQNSIKDNLGKHEIFINDIGDGGAKNDKYERDIRLLTQGIKDEPNNARYYFYLANSYYCIGQYTEAIKFYKDRIKLKDWVQEVWHSYYKIGLCYMRLNEPEKAIYNWMLGIDTIPERLENIYEIIKYYRIQSKQKLAYEFYCIAEKVLNKIKNNLIDIDSYLFLEYNVYDYKIYEEYLIFSYYVTSDRTVYNDIFYKVINSNINSEETITMAIRNHKFYAVNLIDKFDKVLTLKTNNENTKIDLTEFISSTPSLCFIDDILYINIRFVNYKINDSGDYINKENITTINKLLSFKLELLDNTINIKNNDNNEYILKYNTEHDEHYIGLEDIRLFNYKNKLFFNANRGINKQMFIEHGSIEINNKYNINSSINSTINSSIDSYKYFTNSKILKINNQNNIEKNWVSFVNNEDEILFIYNWYPIHICSYDKSEEDQFINKIKSIDSPKIFSKLRGSTNGITVINKDDQSKELWFVCHYVSYEERRHYYHMIVILDKETYSIKKYSKLFKINNKPVEYILGFDLYENNFYFSYSLLDSSSEIGIISYDKLLTFI